MINACVPEGVIFLLYINDLSDDVIYNTAVCADDATLYSKCDRFGF